MKNVWTKKQDQDTIVYPLTWQYFIIQKNIIIKNNIKIF